jgi:exopolysaccharide production protein ExoQ
MNKLSILAEKAFAVAALIHYSGGPMLVIISGGVSEGDEGDDVSYPLINLVFSIIYIITFLLLCLRWKKVIPVIFNNKLVWLLLLIATTSISWSAIPDLTKTRVVALIGTMMFSLYLASRYTLKEQLQLIAWTFGTVVILSLLFCVILPKYGQMGGVHAGAWRGIYNHKNVLGKMIVFSIMAFGLLSLEIQRHRWIMLGFLSASVGLLILSKSSSPLLNSLILLAILVALYIMRWRYILMIPALLGLSSIGLVFYALITENANQLVGSFGKDLTLTGRTNFWPLVLDKIWENPILGYGFGAFWRGLEGPSAYVWNASSFKTPNAHNGYLDLLLELGLVGLLVHIASFVVAFGKSLAYVRNIQTPDSFWPTLLFCYIVLSNLTESSLMVQNNFLWLIQVTVILSIGGYDRPQNDSKISAI